MGASLLFKHILPENCVKVMKIWPRGASVAPPLNLPLIPNFVFHHLELILYYIDNGYRIYYLQVKLTVHDDGVLVLSQVHFKFLNFTRYVTHKFQNISFQMV